jgi:predicted dehydrogenase
MKVAVIGCGVQGTLHLEALTRLPGVDVVAICEADATRLDEAGERYGVSARYADHRSLIDAHALDLVTICTMPNTHRDITLAALESGANVLCEKPFAMSAAEAAEMTAAADDAARRLTIGFNTRFTDSAMAVRRFIAGGQLGRPICARAFFLADEAPWWGRHHVREIAGGGVLAAAVVHLVDLVRCLVGNPLPTTATASMATVFPRKRRDRAPSPEAAAAYNTEDLIFGHVRFDNGFWMSIEGAWVWDKPGLDYGFQLVGDRAHAELNPLQFLGEDCNEPSSVDGGVSVTSDWASSVAREMEDVVVAVRDGHEPKTAADAREALAVQALMDALYESAAAGHEVTVHVPELALDHP